MLKTPPPKEESATPIEQQNAAREVKCPNLVVEESKVKNLEGGFLSAAHFGKAFLFILRFGHSFLLGLSEMFNNTISPVNSGAPRGRGSQDHIIKMPEDATSESGDGWLPEPFGNFSDKKIRTAFVRKVYTILSIQLLTTVAIGVVFLST